MTKFLEGKKTYLVAGATVLYALLGVLLGFMDQMQATELVLAALGLSSLRSGIANK